LPKSSSFAVHLAMYSVTLRAEDDSLADLWLSVETFCCFKWHSIAELTRQPQGY